MLVKFLALWDPKLKLKAFFPWLEYLSNLMRWWPQSNNINKLIFVIKIGLMIVGWVVFFLQT
jgi:hypothetical protein